MAGNQGMNNLDSDFGLDLNLDEDANMFADLDNEVSLNGAGDDAAGSGFDLDLGDGGIGDLDLNLDHAPVNNSLGLGLDDSSPESHTLELNGGFTGGGLELSAEKKPQSSKPPAKKPTPAELPLEEDEEEPLDLDSLGGSADLGEFGLETLDQGQSSESSFSPGEDFSLGSLDLDMPDMPAEPSFDLGSADTPESSLDVPGMGDEPLAAQGMDTDLDAMSFEMGTSGLDLGELPATQDDALPEEDSFTAVPDVPVDDFALDFGSVETAGYAETEAPMEFTPSFDLEPPMASMAAVKPDMTEFSSPAPKPEPQEEREDFTFDRDLFLHTDADLSRGGMPFAPEFPEDDFVAVQDVNLDQMGAVDLNLDALEENKPFAAPSMPQASGLGAQPPAYGAPAYTTPAPMEPLPVNLLYSLPHQVRVELGSVNLNGRDLADLQHGSVIRLERTAEEAVDLMLEGRRIGRGEIVLINGKTLGVRIVELREE
ncbi:MAG: FliM/FliN family flagellar motor switch protein [Deltaproteobacteria bacterium]|nr:FliM/FliN family flagellar motor switch protein [Deltaproteobacteria bacterium]